MMPRASVLTVGGSANNTPFKPTRHTDSIAPLAERTYRAASPISQETPQTGWKSNVIFKDNLRQRDRDRATRTRRWTARLTMSRLAGTLVFLATPNPRNCRG